ncbi:MAG: prepilin peptidase [archaeon]
MEFVFLFWLFLGGIIVASMQDLKRREVDNWLNLFLLVSGFVFVFLGAVLSGDLDIIFHAGFLFVVMFVVMNLFYYGRVFAGGDAKLLVAMTVFFLGANFLESIVNVGVFLLFLMIAGSIYGLIYSFVLYFKNFEKVNVEMVSQVAGCRLQVAGFILFGVILMIFGFLDFWIFSFGVLMLVFPLLYIFARGLESVSMIREVSGEELVEGDWLVDDVRVGRKVVKADWDGLSLEDIELLRNRKKILVKDGLPFVPAFLISFLGYVFLKGWFLGMFLF